MITTNIIIAIGVGMIIEHFTGIFGKGMSFIMGMFNK